MSETPCPFCQRIDQGEFHIVEPDGSAVRLAPLNPVTPGHMLFVPHRHAEHPDIDAVADCMAAAEWWAGRQGEDFNLITSSGSAATQTVPHLHIDYVPRREVDGLHLPWTGQHTADQNGA